MLVFSIPIGILIGTVLGLVGSGGALMSTPLLMMIGGFTFRDASTSALFVVLSSSVLALVLRDTKGISKRVALSAIGWGALGAPIGVWVSTFLPSQESTILLILILLLAAFLTWTSDKRAPKAQGASMHPAIAPALFVFVGCMTGLTGIGGGYLIVPVLLIVLRLEFHLAIATSLVVVCFNTLVSLGLRVSQGLDFNHEQWGATGVIVLAALIGTAIGSVVSRRLNYSIVQKLFAVMLLVLSGGLIWHFIQGLS
jgi:uncharacterized protein